MAETALAFLQDARRRRDVCRPLGCIPEVHHPLGSSEAVIPDALLYYQRHYGDEAHRTTGTDGMDGGNGTGTMSGVG
ncbi:hypothetical protein ABZ759_32725 [Streptomyces sp. NPDC047860]|uniref:hypothetical protein n=1 Tax=Streptomyces sp. NPDC047860 TaxID=3155743 RepID=UPI0033D7B254